MTEPEKDPLLEAIELLFECREQIEGYRLRLRMHGLEDSGPLLEGGEREVYLRNNSHVLLETSPIETKVDGFTRRTLVAALGEERFREILAKHPLSEFFEAATGEADFSNVLLPGSLLEGSTAEALARAQADVRANVFPHSTPSYTLEPPPPTTATVWRLDEDNGLQPRGWYWSGHREAREHTDGAGPFDTAELAGADATRHGFTVTELSRSSD